jgi:hypothetical protein
MNPALPQKSSDQFCKALAQIIAAERRDIYRYGIGSKENRSERKRQNDPVSINIKCLRHFSVGYLANSRQLLLRQSR